MFRTLDAPLDVDLSQYSRLLWQQRISHRIVEHEGRQVLLVFRREQVESALELFRRWQAGDVQPGEDSSDLGGYFSANALAGGFTRALTGTPLTIALIVVCVVLAFIAPLHRPTSLTFALLYPDFSYGTRTIVLSTLVENFTLVQFLKMLSPMLLHAGALHLVFNMLWTWELGKRIEARQSTLRFALAVVVLGLISNTAQYIYGGGNNFGGMSGVVYGLFAYIWMWQVIDPASGLNLPRSLIGFMLLSLVIMTLLQLSIIANEAHLGGFLAGVGYGALTATLRRLGRRQGARG